MKIFLIIAIFLLIGAFIVISNENLRLNSIDNLIQFSQLYMKWITDVYASGKEITGQAIKFFNQ